MAQHIVLMNLVSPLLALWLARMAPPRLSDWLWPATAAQIGILWAWHAPPLLPGVVASPLLHFLMQVSLLAVALWFWSTVFAVAGAARWRSMIALLVTSKLFCLLGVLLVFAPRDLFAFGHHAGHGAGNLADQQLAGLMMLVACPASYVLGGIVLAARWFADLDRTGPVDA